MSEIKHTPGPWEWIGHDLEQVGGDFKTVVGIEVSCGQFCYGGAIDMTVSEADRRLIAAAPDLLETLRELLACSMLENTDGVDADRMDDAEEQARAAIAKVEGQS